MRGKSWAVAVVLVVLALPAPAFAGGHYVAGAPGSGDPFFPLAGNGGYEVSHYSLAIAYRHELRGHVAVFARATENLSRFDLDLRDFLKVSKVTVDGRRATFSQKRGQELVIRPAAKLGRGDRFVVVVDYAGVPEAVVDPDDAIEGWVPTDDGAFVVGEPQGAPGWFPANDNPRDKATYDVAIDVPAGITALGNGVLESKTTKHGRTTWRWRERSPMATYLATATNGVFELRISRGPHGLPIYDAVDPAETAAWPVLANEPEIVAFLSRLYGRYPFEAAGAIVDNAPDVGYALESQTKPNYDSAPDLATVVHELAHQWFGDSVSLTVWPDIWLNEGFATWSEWIYDERHGGATAAERFDEVYATPADDPFWADPPADLPGPEVMFSDPPYSRGAATLQALREKVGDHTFFAILRTWYARNRDGNVTTADFIALAEHISHRRLGRFFDVWLYRPVKPVTW
jgi:aminopeptidase N